MKEAKTSKHPSADSMDERELVAVIRTRTCSAFFNRKSVAAPDAQPAVEESVCFPGINGRFIRRSAQGNVKTNMWSRSGSEGSTASCREPQHQSQTSLKWSYDLKSLF